MKVVQKYDALSPALSHLRSEVLRQKSKKLVFDIDDTLLFDNARSTPNLQVLEFLHEFRERGFSIHLVTARSVDSRGETVRELKRMKVPYDTLDLATEKARASFSGISKFKFEARRKHGPVAASIGDQWGDMTILENEEDIPRLDQMHGTSTKPWIIVVPEDGVTAWGLKLMAA